MELREFAERVLFSQSLEEKLLPPEQITDEHPGTAIKTPLSPGRPHNLIFKPTGTARREFPSARHLEAPGERGRLLHFFGNHELLATELMALVLLKFPDAPAAFRRGVLKTLQDEQEHTRLYMERMRANGIDFGALPVSGYFWRAISGMESPMDYVAGLSLTFEQANLDFARHFSACFAEIGDGDSAGLLQKIYHDEIGHVAYGLKWFRRWKNPQDSDWAAFCRQLKFPLSPARAKGFSVNVQGRKAAGLSEDFIKNLNVYTQSKGRTPTVFLFNPLVEARLAGGKNFSPNQHQLHLQRDLTALPMFLCRQDDIVLVERIPSVSFLSQMKQANFILPEFVNTIAALTERKLGGLRPWGWGPDSVERFRPLFSNLTAPNQSAPFSFDATRTGLFSKAWSADFLRRFLRSLQLTKKDRHARFAAACDIFCPETVVGIMADSPEKAEEIICSFRCRSHQKLVVKETCGAAGSQALRLFEPNLLDSQKRRLQNTFAEGRAVVIEPWLTRVLDFSVQLEMTATDLKLCGFTGLINDARGQFQANWAEPHFRKTFPSPFLTTLNVTPQVGDAIKQLYGELLAQLASELKQLGFQGPIGIDGLIYHDDSGSPKLKPVVEINPRYTMGRVLVELMNYVHPGSFGRLELLNNRALPKLGCASFSAYVAQQQTLFPLEFQGTPRPRIRRGFIPLNDPLQAEEFLAVFQVWGDKNSFAQHK